VAISPEQQQAIVQTLCQLLRESEDPRIRAKAATSLGKLGIESAIADLCQAAEQDPDFQVRLNAIDALVCIAKPELISLMSETPKNQPTFHINSVGNLNTGDVSIQGDQIGTQNNYNFPEPKQTEATQTVADLLQDIRSRHPQATDAEIVEMIDRGLATMQQNNPQKWQKWVDILSIVFVGGVEAVKIVAPVLGIPIEIGKRLYEICDRNRQQLPKAE
jgi:HEAT repeats